MNTNRPESHTLNTNVTTATHAGYVSFMRYLGLALVAATLATAAVAAVQPAAATEITIQKPDAPAAPAWTAIHSAAFPGCVASDAGSFIPARIVVVPRSGEARTMPYTDATVARINATWDNDNPADDLFTIGKCAR